MIDNQILMNYGLLRLSLLGCVFSQVLRLDFSVCLVFHGALQRLWTRRIH